MSFSGARVAAQQLVNCAVLINMSVTIIYTYNIVINIFRVWVEFGGGNRRKPPTYRKSMTNFIT